jgi:hypothetical protein
VVVLPQVHEQNQDKQTIHTAGATKQQVPTGIFATQRDCLLLKSQRRYDQLYDIDQGRLLNAIAHIIFTPHTTPRQQTNPRRTDAAANPIAMQLPDTMEKSHAKDQHQRAPLQTLAYRP